MIRLATTEPGFEDAFAVLAEQTRDTTENVGPAVAAIVADVRADGDAALLRYTAQFDRLTLTADRLRIRSDEIDAAVAGIDPDVSAALDFAATRIEAFHRLQLPTDQQAKDNAGLTLGMRWTPLDAVGIYVPGGRAAYPSTVLMNAIPARIAGVERIAMVTPPGGIKPAVLAAALEAGVSEIWRVGGAQAVAALAYGAGPIRPVDKIVGPGNAYVAAAKRQVFGKVGIDMIAGPSEVLILADRTANPEWIAADLLAQAEHDTAAQSILITDDAALADAVEQAVAGQLKTLPRGATAAASWDEFGAIMLVRDLTEALPLVDQIAPEHLEIMAERAEVLADAVRNTGAIFIGAHTPEAIGDYVAGSNHVLPTARSARFSSGLGVLDFMKRTSILKCGAEQLAELGPAAIALGEAEGLAAHARSVALRLNLR